MVFFKYSPAQIVKIDEKDKKILFLLSENSRMPASLMAKSIRMSRDTLAYRIKRLQKIGVITSFFPEIDFKGLGYDVYHIFLLIDETDEQKYKNLLTILQNHPNTLSLIEYTDQWDIEWVIIAKDLQQFDSVVTETLADFSSIVMAKSKLVVINTYYSVLLPYQFSSLQPKTISYKKFVKTGYAPDKKDLKILERLGESCRISTYEIGRKINLSPDAIGFRIKRLVSNQLIKKFSIAVNFPLLGYGLYTFTLQMKVFDKKTEQRFKTFVEKHPYIIKAEKTLGAWDLLVYVIAETPKEFHKTIKDLKNAFAAEVKNYGTLVAFEEHAFKPVPKVIS